MAHIANTHTRVHILLHFLIDGEITNRFPEQNILADREGSEPTETSATVQTK